MLLTILAALGAAAAHAEDYSIDQDQVLITVQAALGAKQVSAVSRSLEWSLTGLGAEGGTAHLRIPIHSFDSGHAWIDSLFQAAIASDRHPAVELDGAVRSGRFEGTITLHGVSRPLAIPVSAVRQGSQLVVHTTFEIDLRDFGIALPELGPRIAVEFVARLSSHPRAILGGGAIASSR